MTQLPDYPSSTIPPYKPHVLIRSAILSSEANMLAESEIVSLILAKYPCVDFLLVLRSLILMTSSSQLEILSSKPVTLVIQKSLNRRRCFYEVKIDGSTLSCWMIDHDVDPQLRRSLPKESPRKRKRSDADTLGMTYSEAEAELSRQQSYYTNKAIQ